MPRPPSNRLEWQVGGYYTRETGKLLQHLMVVALPTTPPDFPFVGELERSLAGFHV